MDSYRRSWIIVIGFLLLSGLHTLALAQDCAITPARTAASPTVLGDGTPGSIGRADIQAALDAGGFIRLDQGPNPSTIVLDQQLVISREVTLDGGGLISLSGNDVTRVLFIDRPATGGYRATVQNLDIIDGRTDSASGAGIGAVDDAGMWQTITLEVVNVNFRDNRAIQVDQDGGGGGIYGRGLQALLMHEVSFDGNSGSNGGALYTLGTRKLRITDSAFTNNRATGTGGNPGDGGNGGAIGVDGDPRDVDICRTAIVGNQNNAFGAGFFSVQYTLDNSTNFIDVNFQDNFNDRTDIGLGGGVYLQDGRFIMERVAFVNNRIRGAGGLFLFGDAEGAIVNALFHGNVATNTLAGAMSVAGTVVLDLRHATIVDNSAPASNSFVGGILVPASNNVTMSNTIIANNTGGNEFNPWNIRNPVGDGGGNIQWPQQRPNGQNDPAATPTVLFVDPLVAAAPADNGGFIPTLALQAASPAIDAGNAARSDPLDGRRENRDAQPDIGVYEVAGAPPPQETDLAVSFTGATPAAGTVGVAQTVSIRVTNTGITATGASLGYTVTPGASIASASGSGLGTCTGLGTATVSCPLGNPPTGFDATFTATVTPGTAGSNTHTATVSTTVTDPTPANDTASATVSVGEPAAGVALEASASATPDPVAENDPVTYIIIFSNTGMGTATGVGLTLSLDGVPLTIDSATPDQGSCTPAGTTISCDLGSLGGAASGQLTVVVTPTGAGTLQLSGSLADAAANSATVAASTTVTAALPGSVDLALGKTVDTAVAVVGETIGYALTVTNLGPDPATGITLSDELPALLRPLSVTPAGDCAIDGQQVSCSLTELAVDASLAVSIVAEAVAVGTAENSASVAGSPADPDLTNNTAGPASTLIEEAALLLGIDGPATAEPGVALQYTVTVTNPMTTGFSGAQLTVALPAGFTVDSIVDAAGGDCDPVTLVCSNLTLPASGSISVVFTVIPGGDGEQLLAADITTQALGVRGSGSLLVRVGAGAAPVAIPTLSVPAMLLTVLALLVAAGGRRRRR